MRDLLIGAVEDLPVLPSIATDLLGLDRSQETYFDRVVELVKSEPRFAARVLAVANSVAGASQSEITTLRGAVSRVGSVHVPNLVLGMAISQGFRADDEAAKGFWRHSIEVAMGASQLAALTGDLETPPEEAYAIGLLHDIGRLLIHKHGPPELGLPDESETSGLVEAETSFLGVTHAELGAMACRRWGLPKRFEIAVRHHHFGEGDVVPDNLTKLIQLVAATDQILFPADRLTKRIGGQGEEDELLASIMLAMPPAFQLDKLILHQLLRGVIADAKAVLAAIWR